MSEETKVDDTETAKKAASGLARLFYKDGEFSKTGTFVTIANVLVLTSYTIGWFAGTSIELGDTTILIPAFDSAAALAVLSIVNGTYLSNNAMKNSRMKIRKSLP